MHIKIGGRIFHPDAVRFVEVVEPAGLLERGIHVEVEVGESSRGMYLYDEEASAFLEALPFWEPLREAEPPFPEAAEEE